MALPQIIIVHDDWSETSPIVIEMKERFGAVNVKFIKHSQQGIDFIMSAPMRKTIVILDYNFKTGEPTGGDVFKKIREKSSLIYVIIVTKSQYKDINPNDLVQFVNNHALAIAGPNDDYTKISRLVDIAKHQMDIRADIILEEWITTKSEEVRNKPYLITYNGNTYSLNDLLNNIRDQTEMGKKLTRDVLDLAIDLVMKKMTTKKG